MSTSQSAEERKRKHIAAGIDRMKANHMSRQLQLRLQYARLKVDHGWQRQNLNEVENLYFHSSQMRLNKPSSEMVDGSMPPMFVPVNAPTVTGPIPTFRSFKFRPNLTPDMEPTSRNTSSQTTVPELSRSGAFNVSAPSATERQVTSVAPEPPKDTDRSMAESHQPLGVAVQPPSETQRTTPSISTATATAPPTTDTTSVPPALPSNQMSYNPYAPLTTAYTSSNSAQPVKAVPSKLLSQLYPYGTPALTYDSFWSSHTGTNSQKVQKQVLGTTDKSPSLQNTGEISTVNNANRPSANLLELPTAPPYPGAGDSRREQGSPA